MIKYTVKYDKEDRSVMVEHTYQPNLWFQLSRTSDGEIKSMCSSYLDAVDVVDVELIAHSIFKALEI